MGNFIEQYAFLKSYYLDQEFGIINVGYNDFNVVKPSTEFRMQKFYTWHFVISGSGILEVYGNKYYINSGEMFFLPPNTPMRYFPQKSDPWEYVWFSFKGDLIEHYSELVGFSFQKAACKIQHFEAIKSLLKKLFNLLIENEGGYFSVISAFYKILDISTIRYELAEIQEVKRLLDENFATPNFSIEQVCRDVGISHAHLLRLFKKAYGVTLSKYITKKRIEYACEFLQTTNLSVSSVAYSCGFSDEFHFMKTFKKITGLSALQYRRKQLRIMANNFTPVTSMDNEPPKK